MTVGGRAEKRRGEHRGRAGRADRNGGGGVGGGVGGEKHRAEGEANDSEIVSLFGHFSRVKLCRFARVRTHAQTHTLKHARSPSDDNVCWRTFSYAVLRITYLFLHGAENFERGHWAGCRPSKLPSCECAVCLPCKWCCTPESSGDSLASVMHSMHPVCRDWKGTSTQNLIKCCQLIYFQLWTLKLRFCSTSKKNTFFSCLFCC